MLSQWFAVLSVAVVAASGATRPHYGGALRVEVRESGQTDDALDEILRPVKGPLEDDDIAPLRAPDSWQLHPRERNLGAIDELVHEQVVSDEQVRRERAGKRGHALADERAARQLSQEEKARRATFVVRNDGSEKDLERGLSAVLEKLGG